MHGLSTVEQCGADRLTAVCRDANDRLWQAALSDPLGEFSVRHHAVRAFLLSVTGIQRTS